MAAAAVNVRQKFPGAALRDNTRHQIADAAAHGDSFDKRIFFVKCRDDVGMGNFLLAP